MLCLCCLLWQALLPLLAQAHDDRLITTNLPGGASSTTHYNAIGKVDYTVDPLQRSTRYSYNERGERTSTTYADGSSTRVVLNAEGMVEKSFDRAGRGSQTVYDSLGRAVAMLSLGTDGQPLLHANGTPIQSQTVYDDAGRATRSMDELGHVSDTAYDAAGEATDSTIYDQNAQGQAVPLTTHTDYDKDGRAYKVTDALGRYSITRYDDGGRAYQTEHYDRNGTLLTTDKTHFDDAGRVDLTTDAAQHQKRMRYDSLGRLAQVILATQGTPSADGTGQYDLVTRFGYDEMGRKVWQTDANNHATRFGYDERGRMVWRAMPGGQVERMSYNDGGQLESSTDFRGFVTRYDYDTRGRMTLKAPDARLNEATLTWSYPNENTRIATRGSLQTTYTSNPQRGWLQSVQSPTGTLSYGYDDGGQKTSVSAPSGLTSYSYDVLGRVQNVYDQPAGTSNPTAIAAYDYDNVGNLKSVSRGNGIVTSYGYDELNRLSDMVNAKGASEVSRFHYPVRADGKRTGLTERLVNADLVNNAPRVSNRAVTYGYDDAGRLTGEAGDDGLGVAYQTSYTYDKVGNRTDTLYKRATPLAPNTLSHSLIEVVFMTKTQMKLIGLFVSILILGVGVSRYFQIHSIIAEKDRLRYARRYRQSIALSNLSKSEYERAFSSAKRRAELKELDFNQVIYSNGKQSWSFGVE